MTTTADSHRHAPLAVIENYLAQGLNGVLGVEGSPAGIVLIDPHHGTLAIRFPAHGRVPDIVDFQNLRFESIHDDGSMWHQMTVQLDDNVDEVYALLRSILDRVQLSGEQFADA